MAEKPWKRAERRVAAHLGGRRIKAHGDRSADVETDWAVAEVKYRQSLPEWITGALRKARDHAPEGKLPLLVLVERDHEAELVVMRMSDFKDWFGGGQRKDD